jgi:hypothetical protein
MELEAGKDDRVKLEPNTNRRTTHVMEFKSDDRDKSTIISSVWILSRTFNHFNKNLLSDLYLTRFRNEIFGT